MNGLKQEYQGDLFVQNVDIDDMANRSLVRQYNATSIPLIVIFNDRGEISSVFRGLTSAERLRQAIDQALAESAA